MSELDVRFFDHGGTQHPVGEFTESGDSMEVPGKSCSGCKKPLFVGGARRRIGGFDYWESDAVCSNCPSCVGTLRLYVKTLFGLEEDQRVQSMGIRIY